MLSDVIAFGIHIFEKNDLEILRNVDFITIDIRVEVWMSNASIRHPTERRMDLS